MAEDDEETRQARFFLGVRQIVPFQIGSSRYVRILRPPMSKSRSFSTNFCNFLNSRPSNPIKTPHIGNSDSFDAFYRHFRTRNRLAQQGKYLLEGCGASIRLIDSPAQIESWSCTTPALSTRSQCTAVAANAAITFGIANTLSKPMIFSMVHDPMTRFLKTAFLQPEGRITDAKVSQFIDGESIMVSSNGVVYLYGKDSQMQSHEISIEEEFECSSIEFACHPRVVLASFKNNVDILDLRVSNPLHQVIECSLQNITSLLPINLNQVAAGSLSGIELIDLRFPTKSLSKFDYFFSSPPMSLFKRKFGDFDCIIAQCSESSEVIFFPYTESEFAAPLRPFDSVVQPFDTQESDFLTGIATIDNTAIVQFETGAVIGIELTQDEPPCRHFFSSIIRDEDKVLRETFKFQPRFENLPRIDSDIPDIHWNKIFPEISTPPPMGMLYEQPEVEKPEDPGSSGYLIEIEGTMELQGPDIQTALSLFWQNHLDVAKNNS